MPLAEAWCRHMSWLARTTAILLLTPSTVSAPALDVIEPADHNEDVFEPAVIAAVLLVGALTYYLKFM